MLGFESAFGPIEARMDAALECAGDHGGRAGEVRSVVREPGGAKERKAEVEGAGGGAARADRRLGRGLASGVPGGALPAQRVRGLGVLAETFETAITWDRFEEFNARVTRGGAARGRRRRRRAARGPRLAAGRLPLHPRLPRRPRSLLTRSSPRRSAAPRSSSGTRSRPRSRRRSARPAARSPTITRSAATTARPTTSSVPSRSPRRCGGRRRRSTPTGS